MTVSSIQLLDDGLVNDFMMTKFLSEKKLRISNLTSALKYSNTSIEGIWKISIQKLDNDKWRIVQKKEAKKLH